MVGSKGFRVMPLALVLGALTLGRAETSEAGPDCAKAAAPVDRMICEDPQLKLLDEMLAKILGDLKKRLPPEEREFLEGEQSQWIGRRDGFLCPDVYSCLSIYNERLIELKRRHDAITSLKPEQRAMQKRLRTLLARMEEKWELDPVPGLTALPDLGLRGLYLRSGMTPKEFRAWFGVEPFRSGPHKPDRYDFQNHQDFGRHNPEFIAAFGKWVEFLAASPVTKPLVLGFYDNQMMDIAPAYYRMHQFLHAPENAAWVERISGMYRQAIEQGQGPFRDGYHYPYREFQQVAQAISEKEGINAHELTTAGPFWLRRQMDGTEQALFELLGTLLKVFELPEAPAPASP